MRQSNFFQFEEDSFGKSAQRTAFIMHEALSSLQRF